jgi:predicted RNase H-like HicB family nuclease
MAVPPFAEADELRASGRNVALPCEHNRKPAGNPRVKYVKTPVEAAPQGRTAKTPRAPKNPLNRSGAENAEVTYCRSQVSDSRLRIGASDWFTVRAGAGIMPVEEDAMVYKIALRTSEEGFSVSVPGLPGCWSQGATEEEALENIKEAIREYLSVAAELSQGAEIREVEVSV